MFISSKEGYGHVPYFVYTKGAKKSANTSSKTDKIDKELIKEYCKRYKINLKDFEALKSLYYDELITDVKRYEKLISIKEQEKYFKINHNKQNDEDIPTKFSEVNTNNN